jgi:hypothetical protein
MSDRATQQQRCTSLSLSLLSIAAFMTCAQVACVTQKSATAGGSLAQGSPLQTPDVRALLFHGGPTVPRAEPGQGLLWFPFVWHPQLVNPPKDSGLTALDNLFIRDPKLVLRNTQTKAEILLTLREESGIAEKKIELRQTESENGFRFYLPRFLALPQGEYSVDSIRLEIGTAGQEVGTQVNMPFVNPFQSSEQKPLIVSVREGKISSVARVAQTTELAQAAQGLNLKSSSESLDRDVVPVDLILAQLKRPANEPVPLVSAGTSDFPRLRLSLTDESGKTARFEESTARIGFLIDAPCQADGTFRTVWKRLNDEREYLTQFVIKPAVKECHEKQTLGFVFSLPAGDWMLKSSLISSAIPFQPEMQTLWLRNPTPVLSDYFAIAEAPHRWSLETTREREIRRPLMLQVESLSRRYGELRSKQDVFRVGSSVASQQILFLGHFEILTSEAKNDKVSVWDTMLKPSFSLEMAQGLLSSKDVFNAYTLERLRGGRSPKLNTVLRTASEDDLSVVKPVAAEFRGEASKAYATCLQAREEADPLVNVGGELRFTVLKGSDNVTLKKLKMGNEGLSDKWIEACLEKKLISFRFSRKAPGNFQGELRFSAE